MRDNTPLFAPLTHTRRAAPPRSTPPGPAPRHAPPGPVPRSTAPRPIAHRPIARGLLASGALAALVLPAAVACSAADPPAPAARSTAPVIAPGRPGEQARTLAPGEAATAVPSPSANAADVRFVQDMIVHHRQAVDMSLLAPSRAGSDAIRRLAARINDTQELEIGMMTRWLREQGQRVPGHHGGGRDHSGMPGMATPEQLDRLRAASGTEFDRLFVELMIAHHQGAITMATRVLSAGSHTTIQQLATDISVEQAAEIRRMQRLL